MYNRFCSGENGSWGEGAGRRRVNGVLVMRRNDARVAPAAPEDSMPTVPPTTPALTRAAPVTPADWVSESTGARDRWGRVNGNGSHGSPRNTDSNNWALGDRKTGAGLDLTRGRGANENAAKKGQSRPPIIGRINKAGSPRQIFVAPAGGNSHM